MLRNIVEEMYRGNFSFLILIVGILQWFEMKRRNKNDNR